MKRLNFNIKDRKVLYGILVIVVVSVFTLTIAYAALSAVLTISGSAQVTSADWDIYLDNAKVTNGSATTDEPYIITNSTLEFETTLNMPGDFYEFTVDVVNNGSIDAMIENVIKNPELTAAQAKYLKYEVSYQNGESISKKQLLAKGTTMPIKVRIEYRKDLTASDLPTGQVVLDLSLTLEYVQSDGTGSSVNNNGVAAPKATANGSLDEIGTIVTIGDQQFYTIGTEGNNVKLLSMYNLYVENSVDEDWNVTPLASPTGKQKSIARGYDAADGGVEYFPFIGTTVFSYMDCYYSASMVEVYVNDYKTIIEEDYGVPVIEARLITFDELTDSETFACVSYNFCSKRYPWIYSTSYWAMPSYDNAINWVVFIDGFLDSGNYDDDTHFGVRPVIVISKDIVDVTLTESNQIIEFYIDPYSYEAEKGMTWGEWVNSEYNSSNEWSISDNTVVTIEHGQYDEYELRVFDEDDGVFVGEDDVIVPGRVYIRY